MPPRSVSFLLLAILEPLLLFGLLSLAGGCGPAEGYDTTSPAPFVSVKVARAARSTLTPKINLIGEIVAIPERSFQISARISGNIQQLLVHEGSQLASGALILSLDARMLKVEAARARAVVEQRQAILAMLRKGPRPEEIEQAFQEERKTRASVEAARSRAAGLEKLAKSLEVSPVRIKEAQSALRAAQANRAAAHARWQLLKSGTRSETIRKGQARLAEAQAELESAKLKLSFCTLEAPIAGTVTELRARAGMNTAPGTPLLTLVDLSRVFARVRIPVFSLAGLAEGARADVRVAALQDRRLTGRLLRLRPLADPRTGGVEAFIELPNPERSLRPGLSCRVVLWQQAIPDCLSVPAAALADRSGTPVVTVVRDNKAFEVAVQVGVKASGRVQIEQGLSQGDLVVTEGGYGLPQACPVTIKP